MEKNKYINKFDTFIEWLDYINSEVAKSPNVAYISDDDIVQLMKAVPESENIMFVKTVGWNGGDLLLNNINITLHRIGDTPYYYANLVDKTGTITSLEGAFNSYGTEYITEVIKFVVPEKLTTMYRLVNTNSNTNKLELLNLSDIDFSQCTNFRQIVYYGNKLKKIIFSENIDTSAVTDMSQMFYYCTSLTSLDLSSFDTSNVTTMSQMFYNCTSLTSLDLSSFDTSSVTNMQYMFYYCTSLEILDLSSFDTTSVTAIIQMFYNCTKLNRLILSADFFNSTRLTTYDFSPLQSWTDTDSLATFVEAITAHDGTFKTVYFSSSTKDALTQAQKDAITGAGWTIQ